MHYFSRRWKIFLSLVFVAVVVSVVSNRFGPHSNGASPDFSSARYEGAVIAQDIVTLSNQLALDLAMIGRLDKEWNHTEALNKTVEVVRHAEEQKQKAVELSAQLEKMTGALVSIPSTDARTAALDAISNRLALISRLLSYNNYLSELLSALQTRFRGGQPQVSVTTLIDQINAEVEAINNFNKLAAEAMDRFDAIEGKKKE